jgi:very-short-patch-repair endonuclease
LRDITARLEASRKELLDLGLRSAILRGQQTVVVGDSRQLPPTNFFSAALDLDTEYDADQTTADLENVQGDERDVILISIGYGKTAEGYLAHNFGPLNADGGERRLNVLITRARLACQVFANFSADDIDLARTQARGVVALKRYLAYAKDGTLDSPLGSLGDIESPFQMEVAKALTGLGFDVVTQVGCAGFRIDLGIKDPERPGRYLLGIECDGATYHSSRSARDRDRLRQQVLEGLGWRIHRIWSTDWFRNQDVALSKAHEAMLKAIDHWRAVDRGEHAAERSARPAEAAEIAREEVPEEVISATRAVPYRKAEPLIELGDKALRELDAGRMAKYVRQVVEVEAPVYRDVVIARITGAAGWGGRAAGFARRSSGGSIGRCGMGW